MSPKFLHYTWAIATFVLLAAGKVSSDAILDIRILSFDNPENRLANGVCCQGHETATGNCRSFCTTFLRVCVTEANITEAVIEDSTKTCKYGVFITNAIYGKPMNRRPEGNLNIAFRFPFPWTEDFGLILEAWHKARNIENATFIGGIPAFLISRSFAHKSLNVTEGWKKERDISNGTVFEYVMKISCQTAFYGNNCSEMCLDRNNDFGHYVCTHEGLKECRSGWTGKTCTDPICREGCDPDRGYCSGPGECQCRLGWTGLLCTECVALPGCVHGTCRNISFECICDEGWDGLFCSDPICKKQCHMTRGYCLQPEECRCRIGWDGELCEKCKPLPGCLHGYCRKPYECVCEKGWQGIFCESAVCAKGCSSEHGYCKSPDTCRCHVGWKGSSCDECVSYPGCKHGNCTEPWECNCQPGWGGELCDEELTICKENSPCLNGGTCISKTNDDQNYECHCTDEYIGKNCESEVET